MYACDDELMRTVHAASKRTEITAVSDLRHNYMY